MEQPDHACFSIKNIDTLSEAANSKRKQRLASKLAALYQEVSDVSVRAIAILSALNSSDDGSVNKESLQKCAKFCVTPLDSLRNFTAGDDCFSEQFLSKQPFLKLLKFLDAADACLRVHCASERSNKDVSGDQITRLKVRWSDVTTEILTCLFNLRHVGMELHGASDFPLKSSIETWLLDVRAGGSLLGDERGPLGKLCMDQRARKQTDFFPVPSIKIL